MMGLPAEIVRQLAAAEPPKFGVWPENMPVIDAWLMIANQWDTISLADGRVHWHGLDYARVRAGLELAGAVIPPVVWAGVQVMERAAVAVLNGGRG